MSKNVLISGASGFVGTHLTELLLEKGYKVIKLTRSLTGSSDDQVYWNPAKGEIELESLQDLDAVVHLAGENIVGRWTDHKKAKIENSRVLGTKLLSESLAKLNKKPKVLISASAIGYYGNRGDEILSEESTPGEGFLADVSLKWENATEAANDAGIRVINLRIGMVLGLDGGALEKMLLPFRIGIGGKIGEGKQYWSWIAIDDLIGIIYYLLRNEDLKGPVNAVAPNPVTNSEFTFALGRVLNRPTILPLPAFAARVLLGEMADETMLSSARVKPQKLLDSGYKFKYPELQQTLNSILKTSK